MLRDTRMASGYLEQRLAGYTPKQRVALLQAIIEKRRKELPLFYWSPYPKQKEAISQWLPKHKIFGVLGGQRAGKTELMAALASVALMGKEMFRDEPAWDWVKDLPIPDPPINIWVVALDFPTARDIIWREKFTGAKGLLPKDHSLKFREQIYQIENPANGNVLSAKSADSGWEKFQGASVDLVWMDEECDSSIFNECYQRTLDCAGKILLSLTPMGDIASGIREPWVYNLYRESKNDGSDIHFEKITLFDNPYVPETEKNKARDKWADHPESNARLYGDFIQRSGLVYSMLSLKKHVIDAMHIPGAWRRCVTIDPAATGITAALWVAIHPVSGDFYVYREYYQSGLVASQHAKAIISRTGGDFIDAWYIDPFWGQMRAAESHKQNAQLYRDAGIPAQLPQIHNEDVVLPSLEYFQATLAAAPRHPKVFIFRECANLVSELQGYVWDTFQSGPQKGLSKGKPRKGNDHLINALQYLMAVRPAPRRAQNFYHRDATVPPEELARLNSYT